MKYCSKNHPTICFDETVSKCPACGGGEMERVRGQRNELEREAVANRTVIRALECKVKELEGVLSAVQFQIDGWVPSPEA